jgi:hypothetical protein
VNPVRLKQIRVALFELPFFAAAATGWSRGSDVFDRSCETLCRRYETISVRIMLAQTWTSS